MNRKLLTSLLLLTLFSNILLSSINVGNDSPEFETYTLSNKYLKATVIPEAGAMLTSLVYIGTDRDIDILVQPKQPSEIFGIVSIPLRGNPVLFPFANRIEKGKFTFGDRKFNIPNNWTQENNPIHGMAYNKKFKVVKNDRTSLLCKLESQWSKSFLAAFGKLEIEILYTLDGSSVNVKTTITNKNNHALPVQLGFHPFFNVPNRDDASIEFISLAHEDSKVWELPGDSKIPTGKLDKVGDKHSVLSDGLTLIGSEFDNIYYLAGSGRKSAILNIPANGIKVEVDSSENYKNWCICVPGWMENSVMIEPCTSATNSVNMQDTPEANLNVLQPNQTQVNDFNITVSGI